MRSAPTTTTRSNRGCSEAEDVAQQHPAPPFPVEGCRALARDVRQSGLPLEAPPAPRVPGVRPVRLPVRPASGPLTPEVDTAGTSRTRAELCADIGVPDLDPELLQRALTHRSYAYENGGLPTNERLEFLGDSVLGVVVTEALFRTHPDLSEGRLAKLRAAVVNARALADVARTLGLGEHILLGRGEESTGGRDKSSILSDAVEALIGAVYIDRGFETAGDVVHRLFDTMMAAAAALGAGLDWKTSLQELSADLGLGVPEYIIEDAGPDHEKTFTARVRVGDEIYGHGTGRSKKEAEQQAAETAWQAIRSSHASAAQAVVRDNGQPPPVVRDSAQG
jgi:ribonuclease-3